MWANGNIHRRFLTNFSKVPKKADKAVAIIADKKAEKGEVSLLFSKNFSILMSEAAVYKIEDYPWPFAEKPSSARLSLYLSKLEKHLQAVFQNLKQL